MEKKGLKTAEAAKVIENVRQMHARTGERTLASRLIRIIWRIRQRNQGGSLNRKSMFIYQHE